MISGWGIGEEDNKKKWEVWRYIELASSQNGICSYQFIHYAQDESYWAWLYCGGVTH
jgi:hypothetical protein